MNSDEQKIEDLIEREIVNLMPSPGLPEEHFKYIEEQKNNLLDVAGLAAGKAAGLAAGLAVGLAAGLTGGILKKVK